MPPAKMEVKSVRGEDSNTALTNSFLSFSRHRGLIHAYEFAVDQLAFQSPLPICHSSCNTMTGSNYDLALAFPHDRI